MNLNNNIGPKIKYAHSSITKLLGNLGQEVNLTSAQMQVMSFLLQNREKVIYQKDVLTELDLTNATMSGIISRLEAKGFLTCICSESDSRCKQIKLTQCALDLEKQILENIQYIEVLMLQNFSDEEIKNLHQYLERILKNLNQ